MSNIGIDVLASIGKKAGTEAAKQIIVQYGGESSQEWKELLFGVSEGKKVDECLEHLKKLEKQIEELTEKVKKIEKEQLFSSYNNALKEINYLLKIYNDYKDLPITNSEKQKVYQKILKSEGICYQVQIMLGVLIDQTFGNGGVLEKYAEILLTDYTDAFDFCKKLDNVVNHFKFYLILAVNVWKQVCKEVKESNDTQPSNNQLNIIIEDVEIKADSIKNFDKSYYEVVRNAKRLCYKFDECHDTFIMLQHLPDQKYLTGYKGGNSLSAKKPFETYTSGVFGETGMPQIFVNELARGEVKGGFTQYSTSMLTLDGQPSIIPYKVQIDGKTQKWKLIKGEIDGQIYFMFQHLESDLFLDGINQGRVYLSKQDNNNPHLRWQPILPKNKSDINKDGYFLLQHLKQKFSLDSDGLRVYAEGREPSHENNAMKWRLVTNTLFPGEFLTSGQKLLSMNGQISLTYENSGDLVLREQETNKVLWKSQPGQSGAWRCCMQEDGNFVTYAKADVPTWASKTNSEKHKENYCRLIVSDSGDLVILDKNDTKIWSSH